MMDDEIKSFLQQRESFEGSFMFTRFAKLDWMFMHTTRRRTTITLHYFSIFSKLASFLCNHGNRLLRTSTHVWLILFAQEIAWLYRIRTDFRDRDNFGNIHLRKFNYSNFSILRFDYTYTNHMLECRILRKTYSWSDTQVTDKRFDF